MPKYVENPLSLDLRSAALAKKHSKEAVEKPTACDAPGEQLTNFTFVNLTNPSQASDPQTRKFVRRQAQRKYKQAAPHNADSEQYSDPESSELPFVNSSGAGLTAGARKFVRQQVQRRLQKKASEDRATKGVGHQTEQSGNQIVKTSDPLPGNAAPADFESSCSQFQLPVEAQGRVGVRPKSPLNFLLDHSNFIYPIPMNNEAYRMVEYCHADSLSNTVAAFRPIWFGLILLDPASFLQQICTTIRHQIFIHGIGDERNAVLYQQMALRSVNERLSDPILGVSDGIVGTVVSFLTHDHIVKDLERYKINKAGLARIIHIRGGIQTLENHAIIRLMILWEEVCGACAFDIQPNYPLPTRHLPPLPLKSPIPPSQLFLKTLRDWKINFPRRKFFTHTLHALFILNSLIAVGLREIWDDPWFLGLRINPIILRLLPPVDLAGRDDHPGGVVEMACRLAALIYLSDIRVKFMEYHVTGYHFMERLKRILFLKPAEWAAFPELRLWILVIGGMHTSSSDRGLFVQEIKKSLEVLGIENWEEVRRVVESFVWLDEVYGEKFRGLGDEVRTGMELSCNL